jgi:hypothetical protein
MVVGERTTDVPGRILGATTRKPNERGGPAQVRRPPREFFPQTCRHRMTGSFLLWIARGRGRSGSFGLAFDFVKAHLREDVAHVADIALPA